MKKKGKGPERKIGDWRRSRHKRAAGDWVREKKGCKKKNQENKKHRRRKKGGAFSARVFSKECHLPEKCPEKKAPKRRKSARGNPSD